MTDYPRPASDREPVRSRDVPGGGHVRDLMWSMGNVLYDLLIWLRDHAVDDDAATHWHAEADEIAGHMENAVVADRATQWSAYDYYARRYEVAARLIDEPEGADIPSADAGSTGAGPSRSE